VQYGLFLEVPYISSSLLSASILTLVDPVGFEPGEETLDHGVVIRIAIAAHAAVDACISKKLMKNHSWHPVNPGRNEKSDQAQAGVARVPS